MTDKLTPEERMQRRIDVLKSMDEAYSHVVEMEGHDDEDFALMKSLGDKPEDLPEEADRIKYAEYLKNNP